MLTKVCTTMEANRANAYDFGDTSVWGVTDNMTSLGIIETSTGTRIYPPCARIFSPGNRHSSCLHDGRRTALLNCRTETVVIAILCNVTYPRQCLVP